MIKVTIVDKFNVTSEIYVWTQKDAEWLVKRLKKSNPNAISIEYAKITR